MARSSASSQRLTHIRTSQGWGRKPRLEKHKASDTARRTSEAKRARLDFVAGIPVYRSEMIVNSTNMYRRDEL